MTTIPQQWRDVLTTLKLNGFPEAVIAGGALRDLTHGVPVKDVDIFVHHTSEFDKKLDKAFPGQWRKLLTESSTDYLNGTFDTVVAVVDLTVDGVTTPIQIIALSVIPTIDAAMARFDFGICQIVYDGSAVQMTQAFVDDVRGKTFTVIRSDTEEQMKRTLKRWDRFKEKYPQHALVVPPKYAYLVSDASSSA